MHIFEDLRLDSTAFTMDVYLLTGMVCLAGGGAVLQFMLFVIVLSVGFAVLDLSTFDVQVVNAVVFGML